MTGRTLLDAARRGVVLMDGAMGTQLQAAGLPPGGCGEAWNVEHPDRVAAIHRAYVDAGARVVLTNTFGGSRLALDRHGEAGRSRALNRAGAAIARAVAAESEEATPAWVLGDIGPFGGFLAPLGDHEPGTVASAFREQAEALLEGGADGILVETMTAVDELALAVGAAREAGAPFVIGSTAFDATRVGLRTMTGATPEDVARAALDAGADALGANCGSGLDLGAYAEIARRYREAVGEVVVMVRPNAGTPRVAGTAVVYDASPRSLAAGLPDLVDAGATLLGGCCGTDPRFTAAFAAALEPLAE